MDLSFPIFLSNMSVAVIFSFVSFMTLYIAQWQEPIISEKLAVFGKHHFIAFFYSTRCVDEIKAGWEIISGLAFSESKMYMYTVDLYYIITFVIVSVYR